MAGYSKWDEASPDEPLAAVARRSLSTRLEAVADLLEQAATRWEQDPEYVHQMRVWSRRAAAALQLYQPLLPGWRRERLAKHLKQIRRAANDARDDDVFAERLARDRDDPAARLLLEAVRSHRRRVQEPIVAVYRKLSHRNRLSRRAAQLLKRVGTGRRAGAGSAPFGPWAAPRMRLALDEFFRTAAGDLTDLPQLHRLRIVGKDLRYTIELLSDAFAEALRSQVYPMTKDLQDRLGAVNDHATARDRLLRWIDEAEAEPVRAYLQDRLRAEAEQAEQLHRQFLDWWNTCRARELQQAFEDVLGPLPAA